MWELMRCQKRHQCEGITKQKCLYNECNELWKTLIDVSFVAKIDSEEFCDAVEDYQYETNYDHFIISANE